MSDKLIQIPVHGCAHGKLCDADYFTKDGTIVITQNGVALGYIDSADIPKQPTAQGRPVAHFVEVDDVTIRCTGCEAEFDSNLFEMPMSRHAYIRYCPYCGAEMRGEA